ncbi:MAG: hypothetical protein HLUCCO07_05025, partial [Rhodobacteraceae bacterium HLUCCO07]
MARSGGGDLLDRLLLIVRFPAQYSVDNRDIPIRQLSNILVGKV